MSGTNKMAWNLLVQEPGRVDSHAIAANTQTIAQRKASRHNGGTAYHVKTPAVTLSKLSYLAARAGRSTSCAKQAMRAARLSTNRHQGGRIHL
jgi:hypothetical protein